MITVIIFISLFITYVTFLYIRGIYREKKDRKQKKAKDSFNDKEKER